MPMICRTGLKALKEITRVEIGGALNREIQIDIDMYKMKAASLTFRDVEQAVSLNNMTVSGGNIDLAGNEPFNKGCR